MIKAIVEMARNVLKRFYLARWIVRKSNLSLHKLKMSTLGILLPSAAQLTLKVGLPWPSVFESQAKMCQRQIKKMIVLGVDDFVKMEALCNETIFWAEQAISLNPDFVYGARIIVSTYLLLGKVNEAKDWVNKYYALKQAVAKKHKIDTLGISFVPANPLMQTIGTTSIYNTNIKVSALGVGPKTHLVMLVQQGSYNQFVNLHLLSYWRKYIDIIDDPEMVRALEPLAKILTTDDFDPVKIDDKVVMPHCALTLAEHYWQEQNRPPLFTLTQEDCQRGAVELKELGVPEGAWFVCIHVREGGARLDEPFRQSGVNNYYPAIKTITDQGGWVIRMGDKSMTPLADMDQVIDYPHTTFKSDFMDVYLCGSCRFFIGTSSGLWAVAAMFGTPIVQTNYLPTSALCLTRDDIFLPKLLKRINDGSLISFQELFSSPVNVGSDDFYFKYVLKVIPVDNTPEEIEALVAEMLQKMAGAVSYSDTEEELQNQFKTMTGDVEVLPGLPGVPLNARIGQHFLNKYQHLLTGKEATTALVRDSENEE